MDAVQCFCTFSPKKLSKLKPKPKPKPKPGSPTTPKSPLNITPPPRQKELLEVFRRFDTDCDEKISAVELRSYFASIGEYMSYEDAQAIISHLDSDNDGLLDFEDFLRLMEDNGGREGEEDLRAAFGIFEMEKGSGRITAKSLQRVLGQLGDQKSYDECVAMIGVFDSEGKGELGYHEFQQMMAA
ncbi:putative calcium-binding protein CML41 [Sesamum angolense]|uniref:Calcium-binding protein CML41 n=1 Tax=Sesamum angolense TaxID=2727404 RepID=A0AAE1XE35_9LAMI|nr:putative calcium-binding protein CML41 [Sesamum angolense]